MFHFTSFWPGPGGTEQLIFDLLNQILQVLRIGTDLIGSQNKKCPELDWIWREMERKRRKLVSGVIQGKCVNVGGMWLRWRHRILFHRLPDGELEILLNPFQQPEAVNVCALRDYQIPLHRSSSVHSTYEERERDRGGDDGQDWATKSNLSTACRYSSCNCLPLPDRSSLLHQWCMNWLSLSLLRSSFSFLFQFYLNVIKFDLSFRWKYSIWCQTSNQLRLGQSKPM